MTRKPIYHADNEHESAAGDEIYEECEVCHQEFGGVCPINSADCPYADAVDEDDETPDFDDVDNLDVLIGKDEEVEKIIESDIDIPLEDLIDEDAAPGKEVEEITPSKTIEELEAEELEKAKSRRSGKKAAKSSAKPAKPAKPVKLAARKKK